MDSHGYCYFPTNKGRAHSSLRHDLLDGKVRACHEEGLRVGAYVSVGCNDHAKSEWLKIDKNGGPRTFVEQGGYRMVCINSPHVEHNVLPITSELLEWYSLDATGLEPATFSLEGYRHRMEVPHEQGPTGGSANACTNACTDDTCSTKSEAAENATHHAHMPAGVPLDLQRVIDAWPALPAAVRHGLLTIIDAVGGDPGEGHS